MREILGNKKGIRDSVLNELIALYDVQVPLGQLISAELALKLADITEFINREISLYISLYKVYIYKPFFSLSKFLTMPMSGGNFHAFTQHSLFA